MEQHLATTTLPAEATSPTPSPAAAHLELSQRAFYEALARGRTLIRYDRLGCGLSQRSVRAPSLALEIETVAAVARAHAGAAPRGRTTYTDYARRVPAFIPRVGSRRAYLPEQSRHRIPTAHS